MITAITDSIRINGNKGVKANLAAISFQEDDYWIVYIPSLNLCSQANSKDEALDDMKNVLDIYFDYTKTKNTLLDDLKKLGWLHNPLARKNYVSRSLDELKQNNAYLQDIFNNNHPTIQRITA